MWDIIGIATLGIGSVSALSYFGARMIGHRISSAHRGEWTLEDGDLLKVMARSERLTPREPNEDLLRSWTIKGIPTHTGVRNLSNNLVILAMLHSRNNLRKVNEFIQTLKRSGRTGSEHGLHPRADYDFDLTSWATILHLFGDDPDVLYPRSVDHIISEMMAPDRKRPSIYVPWSFGTFLETENHVMMTDGSYYLCSKWLEDRNRLKGSGHPPSRERDTFISKYLGSILHKGFYEFNSDPYSSYTIHAMLNLEAFGSDTVRAKAREILDRTALFYRIGSLGDRRFPPFRRRTDRSGVTSLLADGLRQYMIAWLGITPTDGDDKTHTLIGSFLPYRPKVFSNISQNTKVPTTYLLGHGPISSPEIYSIGKEYLISAGGVFRGLISRLVNRPTTLIIDDGATDLSEILRIGGPGPDQKRYNNTGVIRNIAVGPGPVIVPQNWIGKKDGIWTIYERSDLSILVHSQDRFGIFCVSSDIDPTMELIDLNDDDLEISDSFHWPGGGSTTYDVWSRRDRWSMLTLDGVKVDRWFDRWPKLRVIEN